MTTGQLATAPVAPPQAPDRVVDSGALSTHRLTARLVRRSSGLMMLATAAYMAMEVLSYRAAYPDEASRDQITRLSDSPAVRALQGVPEALDTAAGFAVWDGGWMLSLIVGTWALMTATRLQRGEEDSLRAELVLSRPMSARRLATAQLAVLGVALLGIALAAALAFILLGEPVEGALLFGLGLASFGAVFASVGAVAAQLLDPRRRAVTLAAAAMVLSFVVRTFANSSDGRSWLLPLTPSGWLDGLDPFADNHWLGLLPSLVTALAVSALAVLARGRRDAGTGLLHVRDAHPPRLGLLGSATAYGWRATTGTLTAWAVGCAVTAAMLGSMVTSIADFIADDPSYRKMMEQMGLDLSDPVDGYLRFMAVAMALAFAMFVCWRIGAVRTEEAEGRLESLLVRPLVRWRWLTATFVLALVAATLVVVASGVALWLGALAAGGGVGLGQSLGPQLGTLPLVVLFAGLTVLTFGVLPRLTVGLPVTLVVLTYLLDVFGPLLDWPSRVIAVSPFHHLARLPSDPFLSTATGVMGGIGLAAAALGIVLFSRRDVTGA